MSTKAIIHSTAWQVASQVVMAALSVVTVKFVALGLSKELAGNYNSAYSYLQLFGILADFGLYAVSVREVSRADRPADVLGSIIVLRSLVVFASLGAALFLIWTLPAWRGTPLPLAVTIAALVPLFTLLAGILRTVFQVTYRMHFVFIAEVLQRIITAGLIAYVVFTGTRLSTNIATLHTFLAIGGVGAFFLFILSVIFSMRLMRIRLSFDPGLLKKMVRASFPYGLAFLCVALYRQFDVTLITILRPQDYAIQNAYYGFVGRITDMTYLVPTFLLNSTLPILSARHAKGEKTEGMLGKTLLLLLIIGSISMLFSFFWPRALMQLLTTDSYLSTSLHPGSDTALRMLAVPMFANGIILFSFYVMLAKGSWRRLVATMFGAVVLSLTLNLFLIPRYGFVGAAATSIAVHVSLATLLLPQALSLMHVRFPRAYIVRWLVFSVIIACSLALTAPLLTTIRATVAAIVIASIGLAALAYLSSFHRLVLERDLG